MLIKSASVELDGHRAFGVGPFWANCFSILKIGRKAQADQFRAERLRLVLSREEGSRKLCCVASALRRNGLRLSEAQVWLHYLAI
jgi:hypothetical protein